MIWNGNRGAVSLTFDDGLPCQIEHALPLLDKYGIKATFFLIQNSPYDSEFRAETWKAAIANGHEIGSHGANHRKAAELNSSTAFSEAKDSRVFLQQALGAEIASYCYPYTDAPDYLQMAVRKSGYKQARAGRSARSSKYITRGDGISLFLLPSFHIRNGYFTDGQIFAFIDAALERNAWVTLMFHGVGPDDSQWDNVHCAEFEELMRYLAHAQEHRGLWVAPFGSVAENFRTYGQ